MYFDLGRQWSLPRNSAPCRRRHSARALMTLARCNDDVWRSPVGRNRPRQPTTTATAPLLGPTKTTSSVPRGRLHDHRILHPPKQYRPYSRTSSPGTRWSVFRNAEAMRSSWQLATAIGLLFVTEALCEPYSPIHEAGRCSIRGNCGKKSLFGKPLPCPDNGLAEEPADDMRKELVELCGSKWSKGPVCCDGDQVVHSVVFQYLSMH